MPISPLPDPAAFRNTGWALAGRIQATTLDRLRNVCDRLLHTPPEAGRSLSLGDNRRFLAHAHLHDEDLRTVVLGPELKAVATHFLGAAPYLFNEQFVVKGPKTGAPFAWHQDSGYVGFEHKPYLSVWIALDDTTLENGPIYLLPRDLDRETHVEPHVWDEAAKERVGYTGAEPGQPALMSAGGIVVFSSLTLHRSSANTSDAPRRAYLAQYSTEPILDPTTGRPKSFATPL
ncbi:phytanoyl-CoA dioxygenase family protein [Primorskyibacter sp. S187A]|uniref:phytanoyl-CoA dioxygenase family protein n=1 Tax=Primorskyibacter sp. S187A TaxID=3415130 RepID=UPI003C7CE180